MKVQKKILLILFIGVGIQVQANELRDRAKIMLPPIPASQSELHKITDSKKNPVTPAKVELGKLLFFEPRISKSGFISCNSCHNLGLGGTDGLSAALGHKWTSNPHHLNSPTVYNAVFHAMQFWDGRSPDLEDQAQGPIQAGPEMAASKELVVERIQSIPEYVDAFSKAFPEDPVVSFKKAADAIAAFERTLVTPSRFDDFMNGDDKALSAAEQKGLKTFMDRGCITCHNGMGVGGSMKQMFPLVKPFLFANIGDFNQGKPGLVKVPSLRNITRTAPYFHNGTVWDLKEAIKIMGETQLGVELPVEEVAAIETFLKSLDGRLPKVEYPMLPSSTPSTPKPDLN